MLTFEQAADIEYKKLNKLFEKANTNTPEGIRARMAIETACKEYERK